MLLSEAPFIQTESLANGAFSYLSISFFAILLSHLTARLPFLFQPLMPVPTHQRNYQALNQTTQSAWALEAFTPELLPLLLLSVLARQVADI